LQARHDGAPSGVHFFFAAVLRSAGAFLASNSSSVFRISLSTVLANAPSRKPSFASRSKWPAATISRPLTPERVNSTVSLVLPSTTVHSIAKRSSTCSAQDQATLRALARPYAPARRRVADARPLPSPGADVGQAFELDRALLHPRLRHIGLQLGVGNQDQVGVLLHHLEELPLQRIGHRRGVGLLVPGEGVGGAELRVDADFATAELEHDPAPGLADQTLCTGRRSRRSSPTWGWILSHRLGDGRARRGKTDAI